MIYKNLSRESPLRELWEYVKYSHITIPISKRDGYFYFNCALKPQSEIADIGKALFLRKKPQLKCGVLLSTIYQN